MSYVLFLGFKSTVYKETPTVRLSIDDIFIDEFSLSKEKVCNIENIKTFQLLSESCFQLMKQHGKLNPLPQYKIIPKTFDNFLNKDITFKIFDLDKKMFESKQEHNLIVEIFNSDNNYTNGFLTKSTMISLDIVHIIPKIFLPSLDSFCNRFQSDRKEWRSVHSDIFSIKNSYKHNVTIFDLLSNNVQKDNNTLLWYNNLTNNKEYHERNEWVGGDCYLNLSFTNQLFEYTNKSVENYSMNELVLYGLANKYREYENQRNTN